MSNEKQQVYIADHVFDGHHKVYMKALENIKYVKNISKEFKFYSNIKKYFRSQNDRKYFIEYCLRNIPENNDPKLLHLLYIDITYPYLPNYKYFRKDIKVVATLHHIPQNPLKMILLKRFADSIEYIIVHSEYLQKKLINSGIKNVKCIHYPVFNQIKVENYKRIREKYNIDKNKIVISALGATRWDKGLDILLKSFKYLDPNINDKLILNIAGKEAFLKKAYIYNEIKKNNINAIINFKYIDDIEFSENIELSDVIVIPYRKEFTGNSGPMIEGVNKNKPIIGPKEGNLGYLISNYDLGHTFKSGSPKDLAKSIENYINNGWEPSDKSKIYKEKLNIKRFIKSHKDLYTKLLDKNQRYD